jgi:hypothetical protein
MKYWSFGRFVIVRTESGWGIRSEESSEETVVCGTVSEALSHLSSFVQFDEALENKRQKSTT